MHLGTHNLTATTENGIIQANVTEIYINPDWDPYDDRYDADLAILALNHNIIFTALIRPVCMPSDSVKIDGATIDISGTIVGWGFTKNNIINEMPRQALVTALNDSYCYSIDNFMALYTSNRTFCGGFGDGNPNYGDSGGGFYSVASENVWVQHGIISAIRTSETGQIIPNSLAVYTNVMSFRSWIVKTVKQSGSRVGEAMTKINVTLSCQYYSDTDVISCSVIDLDVQKEDVEIVWNTLNAEAIKKVVNLVFYNGSMAYLPNGFGKYLPNLKQMIVESNLNTKIIARSNFENMNNLTNLIIYDNDIEVIDEESFWDLPNLETLHISYNRLSLLYDRLFEENQKLKHVRLKSNKLLETLPKHLFKQNLFLETVWLNDLSLKTIEKEIFEQSKNLLVLNLELNQLTTLPKHLFQNNLLLQVVSLDSNSLTAIDEDLFRTNINLKEVYLSNNKLESLAKNLFETNLLLETVTFRNNSIKTIDKQIFKQNVNLKIVDLSLNKLEYLPSDLFQNNLLLESIQFSGNILRFFELDFTKLKNVMSIGFYNNICVNGGYSLTNRSYAYHFKDLRQFQDVLIENCAAQRALNGP